MARKAKQLPLPLSQRARKRIKRARSAAFKQAQTRREEGIVSSILHADRAQPDWPERAFVYLVNYTATHKTPFTIEMFRYWAREKGLDDPPDLRAFGGVTQRAIRRGVIRRVGFQPTAASNGSCMPLYEATLK